MEWKEVRELFPNQFLLVSISDYHYEDNKRIVDDVAPIRTIADEELVIHIRKDPLIKVRKMR